MKVSAYQCVRICECQIINISILYQCVRTEGVRKSMCQNGKCQKINVSQSDSVHVPVRTPAVNGIEVSDLLEEFLSFLIGHLESVQEGEEPFEQDSVFAVREIS